MILADLADITGTGATVPLSTSKIKGKWVQLLADSGNGANVIRLGGPSVTSSRGLPMPAGSYQFFPQVSDMFEFYQLNLMYAYIPNGAVLHVIYGVEGSQS